MSDKTTVFVFRDPDSSNEFEIVGDASKVQVIDVDYGRADLDDAAEFDEWQESYAAEMYAQEEYPEVQAKLREIVAQTADNYGHPRPAWTKPPVSEQNQRRAELGRKALVLHTDSYMDSTAASDMIANICHAMYGPGHTRMAEILVNRALSTYEGDSEDDYVPPKQPRYRTELPAGDSIKSMAEYLRDSAAKFYEVGDLYGSADTLVFRIHDADRGETFSVSVVGPQRI